MKVYAIMYTSDVQNDQYNDLFITKDENNNLIIGPEVFLSKEEAEEYINLNPQEIRNDLTIVELGFRSINNYRH